MIKNKEKFYLAFFNSKEKRLYYNQLKELTNLSYSSLQNLIKKLKENNELVEEKTKSNTYYKLTNKNISIEYSKITLNLIENLNIDVKIPIKDFINLIPNTLYSIILFGSVLNKQETKESDIDLLIILNYFENSKLQNLYEKEMKKIIDKIKIEINSRSIYPLNLFITNEKEFKKGEDFVIIEAKNKGFPIKNQFNYYMKNGY